MLGRKLSYARKTKLMEGDVKLIRPSIGDCQVFSFESMVQIHTIVLSLIGIYSYFYGYRY